MATKLFFLVRKNFLLRKASIFGTLVVILLPFFFAGILIAIQSLMNLTSGFHYGVQSDPSVLSNTLPSDDLSHFIAYTDPTNKNTVSENQYDTVMAAVALSVGLQSSHLVKKANEDDLNDFCSSSDCVCGIVFASTSNNSWSYTLKIDYDNFYGDSDKRKVDVRSGSGMFGSSGLLTVQMTLDQAVTAYAKNPSLPASKLIESVRSSNFQAKTLQFTSKDQATEDYESRKAFYNLMDFAGGCIFILFFVSTIYYLVSEVLVEKETRIQEAMMIMGLKPFTYYMSWIVTAFILLSASWVGTACMMAFVVYKDTSLILFVVLFLLTGISMIPLAFICCTFFDRSKSGAPVSLLLVVGMALLAQVLSDVFTLGKVAQIFLSFLSPGALVFSVLWINGREFDRLSTSFGDISEERDNYTFLTGFIMLVLDIVLYSFLSWYLKQVIPSQFGSPKPWNFMFTSQFWSASEPKYKAESGSGSVVLKNLTKEFNSDGKPLRAVNGLSFSVEEGDILSFLGHNGAGKTTTMSMLTGLTPITEGDAYIYGYSVKHELDKIRRITGFCPQHDVLWDNLTVRQILMIYAAIKGVSYSNIKDEVNTMIEESGLNAKQNYLTKELSGGQKRKLSVSIALLGGSRVVFLDEPTSGMDPFSRRAIWDVILKLKSKRTLLLSTHFMDEADILGDKIAILSKGELSCFGTSLELKAKYSNGYKIAFAKSIGETSRERDLFSALLKYVPEVKTISNNKFEIEFSLPSSSSSEFPLMLKEIDSALGEWHFSSYGITAPSLEDVFLNIAKTSKPQVKVSSDGSKHSREKEDRGTYNIDSVMCEEMAYNEDPSLFLQFTACFKKRSLSAIRDYKLTSFMLLFPFAVIGLGVYLARDYESTCNFDEASDLTSLMSDFFYDSNTLPVSDAKGANMVSSELPEVNVHSLDSMESLMGYVKDNMAVLDGGLNIDDTSNAATSFSNYTAAYKVDERTLHALDTFNVIGNTFYRAITGSNLLIHAFFKLFPSTTGISPSGYNSSDGSWLILTVIVGFAFLSSNSITFVVEERNLRARHQQRVSGIRNFPFWLANAMWDGILLTLLCLYSILLIRISTPYIWHFYLASIVAFLLFAMAILPFFYLFSFAFKNPSSAQAGSYAYCLLVGIVFMSAFFSLWFNQAVSVDIINQWFALGFTLLSPLNGLLHSLMVIMNIASLQCTVNPDLNALSIFDMKLLLVDYFVLLGQTLLYWLLVIYVENREAFSKLFRKANKNVDKTSLFESQMDGDVKREYEETNGKQPNDSLIIFKNIRKEYPKSVNGMKKVAVKNVSLTVNRGDCLGLLGPNGAGKTSLLKAISGDIFPSAGECFINGYSLSKDLLNLQKCVGICPQFDALFKNLTVREHLDLYATARGLCGSEKEREVSRLIKKLDLTDHQHKKTMDLSGGNKRKCSVAIALIGKPPVLLLDEPSTGMDPAAKRFMWDVIETLRDDHAIILTTHSMEEVSALCNRVAILVDGEVKCLGSPQHLKNKFGDGYYIQMKLENVLDDTVMEPQENKVAVALSEYLPSVQITEKRAGQLNAHIPSTEAVVVGQCFEIIEKNKSRWGVANYDITQTTLEQIFLEFGTLQKDVTGEIDEDKKVNNFTLEDETPFSRKNSCWNFAYALLGFGLVEAICTWAMALLLLLPVFTFKISFRYFSLGWRFMTPYGRTRNFEDIPLMGRHANKTGVWNVFRKFLGVLSVPFGLFLSFIYLAFALVNVVSIVGFPFAKFKLDHCKMVLLSMKSEKQEKVRTEQKV